MVLVRQFDRRGGKSTAALGLLHLEVTDMAQPGEELAFRITRVGGDRIPGNAFLCELAETCGDQHIRRGEVTIILLVPAASAIASTPTAWTLRR
jgi:hypothetical protein